MPGRGAAFGRGMLIGVGAALLYAASRESTARSRPDGAGQEPAEPAGTLVDWGWAEKVAVRASGQALQLHPNAANQLAAEYRQFLIEIEGPLQQYTGNSLAVSSTPVQVLDRPGWIRANMVAFRDMLAPLEEYYRDAQAAGRADRLLSFSPPGGQLLARRVLGTEMGVLVGYLSQRVLGQYDISLLGKEPIAGGKLYFVEPNIRQVEESLAVPREEFRRWITLHEATHAHEFEVHPWVREYMNTTLRTYLRLLVEDLGRGASGEHPLVAMASRLANNLRQGDNLIMAVMSPRQRELMSRLQALMSLAEGYSNHVMNAVGITLLPHFQQIHDRVEQRQARRSQAETLFLKITGLAMKMEQYRKGERFVDAVVAQRGMPFMNRAWQAAENLPTEAEIAHPEQWIRRLEQESATA